MGSTFEVGLVQRLGEALEGATGHRVCFRRQSGNWASVGLQGVWARRWTLVYPDRSSLAKPGVFRTPKALAYSSHYLTATERPTRAASIAAIPLEATHLSYCSWLYQTHSTYAKSCG